MNDTLLTLLDREHATILETISPTHIKRYVELVKKYLKRERLKQKDSAVDDDFFSILRCVMEKQGRTSTKQRRQSYHEDYQMMKMAVDAALEKQKRMNDDNEH